MEERDVCVALNKMLEKIKNFPPVRIFYRLPGLMRFYHFLLAWAGAVFYRFPSRHIFVIGITGTKGKTTTLDLVNSILESAGKKTALLSSLRVKVGDKGKKNPTGNSMPGRGYIQKFLKDAVGAGCQYALIEVTSQGVVLSRHRFIDWKIGVLTNLAPEHIEAHGSFEKYRKAKLDFLRCVGANGGRIFINKDDRNADFFFANLKKIDPIAYSRNDDAVLRVLPRSTPLRLAADNGGPEFALCDFNKENIAAAAIIATTLGISEKTTEGALRNFHGVPGRMEFIQKTPFSVVIDYAHTPDSLHRVYGALRESRRAPHAANRMICVLGAAGGGRDKWKRPEMGKIAAEYCDEIILTNEDPYDEKPDQILSEIRSGITGKKRKTTREILDRREAVKEAVFMAEDGDTVIITGKGSEDWIHVEKGKKIPWNERAVVEAALRSRHR